MCYDDTYGTAMINEVKSCFSKIDLLIERMSY